MKYTPLNKGSQVLALNDRTHIKIRNCHMGNIQIPFHVSKYFDEVLLKLYKNHKIFLFFIGKLLFIRLLQSFTRKKFGGVLKYAKQILVQILLLTNFEKNMKKNEHTY